MSIKDFPEQILLGVGASRRSFLRKLIVGTAFVAPSVSSFSMRGLGIGEAAATTIVSNLTCKSFDFYCSNQVLDCSLVRTEKGNFSGCNYHHYNLQSLNLSNNCFAGANFQDANLSFSNLDNANLAGANLQQADLTGTALGCADLSGANLDHADLGQADVSGARLEGANLRHANLTAASLQSSDLLGANLQGANLTNADLTGANMSGANLLGAKLTGVTWSNTTCPDGTNSDNNGGTCLLHL